MRKPFVAMLFCSALAACASTPDRTAGERDLYLRHAGAPVSSFVRTGGFNQWTPLGDDALAVWISPSRAYLLDVSHCPDLEWAHGITVGDSMGRVSARLDRVVPLGAGRSGVPCRIEQIRPLDVKALRDAERAARAQRQS